jgi:hypothetical protein
MPRKRPSLKMALHTELPVYRETYKLVLEIFVSTRTLISFCGGSWSHHFLLTQIFMKQSL